MSKVCKISELIGIDLNLKREDLNELKIAAELHDVGKIKIPFNILYKPGRLSENEYEIIKQHSQYGAQIVEALEFNRQIIKAVYHHHEKFDGTGYPEGLQGHNIPLYSRIIAVADAFDAMTSKRIYMKVKKPIEAIKEINICQNSHFDSEIVLSFNKIIEIVLTMDNLYSTI